MSEMSNTPSLYSSAYLGHDSFFKITPPPPSSINYGGAEANITSSIPRQGLAAYDESYIVNQPSIFKDDTPTALVEDAISPAALERDLEMD
jgi:hypothetical protein